MNSEQLWVGEFNDGEVVIFSPAAQKSNEPEWVYLWSEQTRRTEGYAKDIVRKSINKTPNGTKSDKAIAAYIAWLSEQRAKAEEEASQNHRRRITKLGMKYAGIRGSGGRAPRTAQCWDCKDNLDNSIQLECNSCGWILCVCGACGCGYS